MCVAASMALQSVFKNDLNLTQLNSENVDCNQSQDDERLSIWSYTPFNLIQIQFHIGIKRHGNFAFTFVRHAFFPLQ